LERQTDAHLNPAELDALVRSGDAYSRLEEADVMEARKHVERCKPCRSLVDLCAARAVPANLQQRPAAARKSGCPREDQWRTLAADLTHGSEAEALLSHAADCDYCGPLLRQSLADFAEAVTPEEEVFLTGLESVRPEWQERMAARFADEAGRPRIHGWLQQLLRWCRQPLFARVPVPAWAYAGSAVLVAAFLPMMIVPPSVDNLLAAAYTGQRTMEPRIPQAAYGPLRVVKGSAGLSRLDRPPALLESEARIARKLAVRPNDPQWLQARWRAEVLEREFDSAVTDLQRCLTLRPDSPHLMTDLASAYFGRADARSAPPDYNTAIEFLSRALKMTPDDPVALFNRAIVHQRMHLYVAAIEDWRHYLRVDPNSKWAGEARRRLAEAEQAK
jgi:tetratricopeptide (TPR) repeat protein